MAATRLPIGPEQASNRRNHILSQRFRHQRSVSRRINARLRTPVASEGFITAIAAQAHLDMLPREARNHVGGNSGVIAEGLTVVPDEPGKNFQNIPWVDNDFVVFEAEMARHLAGIVQLTPSRFLETDGK